MKTALVLLALLAMFAGIKATRAQKVIFPAPVTTTPKQHYILPPAEFDHDYDGDLTLKIVATVEELRTLCGVETPWALTCALLGPQLKSCIIILVEDKVMRARGWTMGLLLRHERGHCNGWGSDHAGERSITWPTTHWVPESERVKIPADRLEQAVTIRAKDQPK